MKYSSPLSLSIIAGFIVSVALGLSLWLLHTAGAFDLSFRSITTAMAISLVAAFGVVYFLVGNFLYGKIKVIYKTLASFKNVDEKELRKFNSAEDILGNVNLEVEEWDKNRTDEIAELKRNEIFRKEFLGNVSHELKTPLFNIQGYIHTLIDGGLNDAEVNLHYLQRAARSAERLCLIVEDLESISKLEAGELMLDQRIFDVTELVKDVFDSLELKAKESNMTLRFKNENQAPLFVSGDKERLRQVFVNLLVNSIKYGKAGGDTVIAFEDLHEKLLVEVIDNGIGIGPEHLPRLFERFYRVDKSRSRDQGGTGLGLSIVKHILEAHQQTISVKSSYGIGTTFAFTLSKAQ